MQYCFSDSGLFNKPWQHTLNLAGWERWESLPLVPAVDFHQLSRIKQNLAWHHVPPVTHPFTQTSTHHMGHSEEDQSINSSPKTGNSETSLSKTMVWGWHLPLKHPQHLYGLSWNLPLPPQHSTDTHAYSTSTDSHTLTHDSEIGAFVPRPNPQPSEPKPYTEL